MKRFFTTGRFTQAYAQGIIKTPEDRGLPLRRLTEAAGAKYVDIDITTGVFDFLFITEAEDVKTVTSIILAVSAAGTVTNLSTSRAFTTAEFKEIAEGASAALEAYRSPG